MNDDRWLVTAIAEGRDEGAFRELYDRHTPMLYGLALRLTGGNASEAEEVVHEAWIRAVERLARFAWRSSLSTWLCGFVVNGVRELIRDALPEVTVEIDDPTLREDDRPLAGAADRLDLERALAALPPGRRHVLVLHDVEGYTHEEIASQLGIAPGTSKSQLARARAAVRRALTTEGAD